MECATPLASQTAATGGESTAHLLAHICRASTKIQQHGFLLAARVRYPRSNRIAPAKPARLHTPLTLRALALYQTGRLPFQRTIRLLLIVALLSLGGAHWVVLQSVAWTTMLVEHSRESPLLEAVRQTFDGAHPCSLCHRIEAGRKTGKQQELVPMPVRVELFYEPPAGSVPPVRCAQVLNAPAEKSAARLWVPSLRPPRGC